MAAIYFGLRYYAYVKINSFLDEHNKIAFSDVDIGFFPLRLKVRNLKALVIKNKKVASFDELLLEVAPLSLLSDSLDAEIHIFRPRIYLDENLLKKKNTDSSGVFELPPWLKKSKLKLKIVDGSLVFKTPRLTANLVRFNLYSFSKGESNIYRVTSPHLKVTFPLSHEDVVLQGQLICECKLQGSSIKISKFYWETEHVTANANGRIYFDGRISLGIYNQGSGRQILDPILKGLSIHEFMYANARFRRSKSGMITISGTVNFNSFTFGGESFSDLDGAMQWDNYTKRLKFNGSFRDGPIQTILEVDKQEKNIHITAQNISANKVTRVIYINNVAPVGSIIKKGDFTIQNSQIKGTAELVQFPGSPPPGTFNISGTVHFNYNSKQKSARFSSPELTTEFGKVLDLKGEVDPNRTTHISVQAKAQVNEANFLHKYTSHYIKLSLDQWQLQGGNSTIDLDIKKIRSQFVIDTTIHFQDIYSRTEPIQVMSGHIGTNGHLTTGTFHLQDKDLEGQLGFSFNSLNNELVVNAKPITGKAEKILNILGVNLTLKGIINGDFTYTNKKDSAYPHLLGNFQAGHVDFYDFALQDVSGYLDISEAVSLNGLKFGYMNGQGLANIYINYVTRRFDLDGKIQGIDTNRMNNEFSGKANFHFKGSGAFETDPIHFSYDSKEIRFYKDQPFSVKGEGNIFSDFSQFRLETDGEIISSKNIVSPVQLHLTQTGGRYSGDFHGEINDINLVVPWGSNEGRIIVDGTLADTASNPGSLGAEGHAVLNGKELSFPNFPHALKNYSGDLIFNDLNFTLRSIQGSLGNGNVDGNGYLNIKNNRLDDLFFSVSGRDNTLYVMDRTSFSLDADLTLKYTNNRLLLGGELRILSGRWEREIDDGVSFNTDPSISPSVSTIMDMLDYDLRIVGNDNIEFDNSFAKGNGRFDLKLTGNADFPVLLGSIESHGGNIYFSGKAFDMIKGKIVFNNKFRNDPILDIESEAFIKTYRIQFNIKGPSSQPNINLLASPPLSTPDIMSLIAVGELFRRSTSSDLSTQVGRGTTGLIAAELTAQIQKRTKKIFGDYLLRIDPNITNITGSSSLQNTSRLILGKHIAKDFMVVYSTNFANQREQVVYVQYQLSPSISLIAMRNYDGRYSLDLRFRKRY